MYRRVNKRARAGRARSGRFRRNPRRPARPTSPLPYEAREALLSPGELAFYRVLRRAVAGRFAISLKTRLADVLYCPPDLWETADGRRVAQKHLDFVLYDPWTARIMAAIELDDRSHDRPERRLRDKFVDQALQAGGVTLLRIPAAARYDGDRLWSTLEAAIARHSP